MAIYRLTGTFELPQLTFKDYLGTVGNCFALFI